MKWTALSLIAAIFLVVERLPGSVVLGYGDGAPRSSCEDLRPIHTPHEPQRTTNPYQIVFLDDVVDYRCGESIRSRYPAHL